VRPQLPPTGSGSDAAVVAAARTWLQQLATWEARRDQLKTAQDQARSQLDAATQRLAMLQGIVAQLPGLLAATTTNAARAAGDAATTSKLTTQLATLEDGIADVRQARDVATSRLLAGPPVATPLVLLPLRLETSWADGQILRVRIYPDAIGVDTHQPKLTAAEQAAGAAYWQLEAQPATTPQAVAQTFGQLAGSVGPQRAAYIVETTAPAAPAPPTRESSFDISVEAALLPDRFALVAFASSGEPINLAAAGAPARYVTWTADVPAPLALGMLDAPATTNWMTDLSQATSAGMAVTLSLPAGAPPIDTLLCVGVRGDAAPDLAGLISAHAFTDGAEVLADGAPTNNSSTISAVRTRRSQLDAARSLISPPPAAEPPTGSAGAQLADTLGLPRAALTRVAGAHTPRAAAVDAMRLVVALGADGALAGSLGLGLLTAAALTAAGSPWSWVTPGGGTPALRLGRQPYGVLPATAPGRWTAQPSEAGTALQARLREWALATGPAQDRDPAYPPAHLGGGVARAISRQDDSQLVDLLAESASALAYTATTGTSFAGAAALVGPAAGDDTPQVTLTRIAQADASSLLTLSPPLPSTLLARVAVAAKQQAAAQPGAAVAARVNQAIITLAALAGDDLARLLTDFLDAASHRFDAWLTGVAQERLAGQRAGAPAARVGAYGLLTGVQQGSGARSYGHVLAPSLAHAATAAVLRSGFLGERRAAWAQRRQDAQAALDSENAAVTQAQQALSAAQASVTAGQQAVTAAQQQLSTLQGHDPHGTPAAEAAWRQQVAIAEAALARAQIGLAQANQLVVTSGQQLAAAQHSVQQALTALAALAAPAQQLAPLGGQSDADLPLAIDLRSDRAREARRTLRAVRAGQPLAAVLGYQFERDLLAAGKPQYLAAFRKLSRFHTGSALEALEEALRQAQEQLAQDLEQLAQLEAAIPPLQTTLDQANAVLSAATAEQARAQASWQPYAGIAAGLAAKQAALQSGAQTLTNLLAHPPAPARTQRIISKPVIVQNGGTATVEREPDYDEYTWGTDAGDTAWASSVAQARATIALTQAVIDQDSRIEASAAYIAAQAALAAAGNFVASARSGQSDAQEKHDAAVAAVAAYQANTVQPQVAAVDAATRAIADALAALLSSAQASVALTATVDGLALRDRYRQALAQTPPLWDHTTIPFPAAGASPVDPELNFPAQGTAGFAALGAVLDQLDSHVDTVADLISAESVHQLVQGNTARAGGALDIAATGSVPDDLDVIRTPRPGYDTSHRLLVAIDPALAAAWTITSPGAAARSDPLLAAWVSHHLPAVSGEHAAVHWETADGSTGASTQITAAAISTDPLEWVRLGADPAELDQRIARAARAQWAAGGVGNARGTRVVFEDAVRFARLCAAAAAVREVLATARALDPSDLVPPPSPSAPSAGEAQAMTARVTQIEGIIAGCAAALTSAAAGGAAAALEDALFDAAALGVGSATPQLIDAPPTVAVLQLQAQSAAAQLERRVAQPFAGTISAQDSPAAICAAARERISEICSMRLPVLAAFAAPADPRFAQDMADTPARLADATPAQIRVWLQARAPVRAAVEAFLSLYDTAETLVPAGARLDVRATQTPDGQDTPLTWVGTQAAPPPGGLSLVVQRAFAGVPPAQIAGLFVDAWNEVVPDTRHAPALAFHYDQPDSTPPQTLIVCVAPDTTSGRQPATWDLDTLLETLAATLALARDRAVSAEARTLSGVIVAEVP